MELVNFSEYKIPNILPAEEELLLKDIYLIVLHAAHVPPHLAVSIQGKLFTLSVDGANVDAELTPLLKLIRQRNIESLFIKLNVPPLFTMDHLREEIKKYTLSYPRVDVGIATCLSPIKDFCSSVYNINARQINFLYDLLPRLYAEGQISSCFHLNLNGYLQHNSFGLKKYSMFDIHEGIRKQQRLHSI